MVLSYVLHEKQEENLETASICPLCNEGGFSDSSSRRNILDEAAEDGAAVLLVWS